MKKIDGVRVAVRRILKEEDAPAPQAQTKTDLNKILDAVIESERDKPAGSLFRSDPGLEADLKSMFASGDTNPGAARVLMNYMHFIPGLKDQKFVLWWMNSKFGTNEDQSEPITQMLVSTFGAGPEGDEKLSDKAKRAIIVGIIAGNKFLNGG